MIRALIPMGGAALAAALLAGCSPASAAPAAPGTPGRLSVADPVVVVPVSPGAPAPFYLTIDNGTGDDDTLLTVTTPVAGRTLINDSLTGATNGGLDVPANASTALDAFDSDVLLLGPRRLRAGSEVPLTLTFAHAGRITVHAVVRTVAQIAVVGQPTASGS